MSEDVEVLRNPPVSHMQAVEQACHRGGGGGEKNLVACAVTLAWAQQGSAGMQTPADPQRSVPSAWGEGGFNPTLPQCRFPGAPPHPVSDRNRPSAARARRQAHAHTRPPHPPAHTLLTQITALSGRRTPGRSLGRV
ncbi:hypothetical protein JZ751_018768 [Albula glossodonta]|uniref:Uncharacterized protein n=1 Tax=Albula glossodonta TaxID=121402 RepID=A0A8T2NNQ9_9TELE|nr:hypothetical protein JZ751_018768 [Albula glossodonta]